MAKPATHEHPLRAALFTDLYELSMSRAYGNEDMNETAAFELFYREMPKKRDYMISAGLDDTLRYIEGFQFTGSDIDYLRTLDEFQDEEFLERLRALKFTGDVYAMREGTPVFADEPIVQVVAPMIEAQILETLILNQIHYATVAATKASRVVVAARGRNVVDFGSRRAHGADAALKAARVTWLVGGAGTSNMLAGKIWGVPVFGTMAHSYIQAHDEEMNAFEGFTSVYPDTTLLVDTYDTVDGVRKVIELARKLGDAFKVQAVRLDSGNLVKLAGKTRRMLDDAGLQDVKIFISSGLDEHKIKRLLDAGAPADGFGVGTKMVVSPDAPDLDMAYKLVEYAGKPRMKLSSSKKILPGRKQIYRVIESGTMQYDVLGRWGEEQPGEPLLQHVMHGQERLEAGRVPTSDAREYTMRCIEQLPEPIRALEAAEDEYEVRVSQELERAFEELRRTLKGKLAREKD